MEVIKENKKNWKLYRCEAKHPHPSSPPYCKTYLDYKGQWIEDVEELENFVFKATLIPDSSYRGRSAAGLTFSDTATHGHYTMRIAKLTELIKGIASGDIKVENGGFTGLYTFFKQGANYSIGLYSEDK